jgi:hypothetical protein
MDPNPFSSSLFLSALYRSRTHIDPEPGTFSIQTRKKDGVGGSSGGRRPVVARAREAGDRQRRYLVGPRRSKLGGQRPAAARPRDSGDRDIVGQRWLDLGGRWRRDLGGPRRRYLGVLAGARKLGRPATGRDASSEDRPAAAQAENRAGGWPVESCGMRTSGRPAGGRRCRRNT